MLRLVIAILSLGSVNCLVVGETTQIKMFSMPIPIGTLAQGLGVSYWSSDFVVTSNNPFPDRYGLGTLFPPDVLFWPQPIQYTEEEIYNISESRFLNVVGIAETMILDDFLAPGSGLLGEPPFVTAITQRPFISRIDKEVLIGMTSWDYDGSWPLTIGPYYTIPTATGTFNQAEQRFYVSDGRQYQVIPEPSSISLLLAGGAVLMAGRRK